MLTKYGLIRSSLFPFLGLTKIPQILCKSNLYKATCVLFS